MGIVLFFGSFPLLVWNEGRAIARTKTLQIGAKEVVSIESAPVDPANNGKLVHVTGDASVEETLTDPDFGISATAIKLQRFVEMYQWTEEKETETEKKLGGGEETVTTYSYKKAWSSSAVDSSEFQQPDGHENPGGFPVQPGILTADPVSLGAFTLSEGLLDRMTQFETLEVKSGDLAKVESDLRDKTKVSGGMFYLGADASAPKVGDTRVSFQIVPTGTVSVIARQYRNSFEPYKVPGLGTLEMLETGTVSPEMMFAHEHEGNAMLTWILRLVGFVAMFFGMLLVFKPLSVFADVVPFIGSLVGAGMGFLALILSLPLSLLTIALAWVAFRPLVGIPLLILSAVVLFYGIKTLGKRQQPKTA